ncbi:MAG: DUF4331 domain-containing protein [Fimbriimonadaceae bacterium]|nr:DUF4331 domain-containing protein [Fimbriimonadaceae bacterium]QYK57448.1 MAG: DUF4331 domain-containing protein [Fimbriimonadaceae bacterium]
MTILSRSTLIAATGAIGTIAWGASHSDAPMMVLDPAANITDVYAFVGKDSQNKKVLNLVMSVNPLEDPGNGVIYDKFAEDVTYAINVSKAKRQGDEFVFDGSAAMTFVLRFKTTYKNKNTILSFGLGTEAGPIFSTDDARHNALQSYTVFLERDGQSINLGSGQVLKVPPVNVGPRTTPNYYDAANNRIQGATQTSELPAYVQETVFTLSNGVKVWAGQREDGFYADTPAIFDFLGVREPGKDGFSGTNVHSIALQVPITEIVRPDEYPVVGVYGATFRQSFKITSNSEQATRNGAWVQVSRMGNPLFNEVLVALGDKDRYNQLPPTMDGARFKKYAENCELAFLLNAVLGTNFQVDGRTDLVGLFIPDLIKVDLSTDAVRLPGDPGYSRLSVFGGDTTTSAFTGQQVPSGWPNGRRLGDDVVDIALTAVASGPSYSQIVPVSDNANANDTIYDRVFPYGGTPWGGPGTTLH